MDTEYRKFIWTTVKEHCFTSFVAFTLMALLAAAMMNFHSASVIAFVGCSLFGMGFGMAWNTARYIESIVQIEIDEENAG
ncbi:MAG TPA: hypothetical protein DDW52_13195 [Planctomycetaceae bacterium]|nr:hypothetical protein [Planctomycetaceae bacterium]